MGGKGEGWEGRGEREKEREVKNKNSGDGEGIIREMVKAARGETVDKELHPTPSSSWGAREQVPQ